MSKIGDVYVEIGLRADKLASDLKKTEDLSKNAAKKIEDDFKNVNIEKGIELSAIQIDKIFKQLKASAGDTLKSWKDFHNMSDMEGSSKAWADYKKEVVLASGEINRVNQAISGTSGATNRLMETQKRGAMVGLSFNRIIQDAGWFGNSMAMGFMAVGNNITYFAEQLSYAKGQGLSMIGVFKGMLTGTNAWMFAINLAVSALTFFSVKQQGAKDATKQTTEELDKQTEAIKKMSSAALGDAMFKLEQEIELLKKKSEIEKKVFESEEKQIERRAKRNLGGITVTTTVDAKFRYSNQTELDALSKKLQMYQAQQIILGGIENANNRIAELELKQSQIKGDANDKEAQQQRRILQDQLDALKTAKDVMTFKEGKKKKEIDYAKEEYKEWEELQKLKEKSTEEYYNYVKFADENYMEWKSEQIIREVGTETEKNAKLKKLVDERYEYERDKVTSPELRGITPEQLKYSIENKGYKRGRDKEELDDLDNKLTAADKAGTRFANNLSGGFGDAIMAGKNLGDVLENIIAQLAGAVIQAGLFATIMSVINPSSGLGFLGFFTKALGFGHSGGDFISTPNGVMKLAAGGSFIVPSGYPNDSFPLMVETGERVSVTSASQTSFNDRAIVSELQSLRSEIGSLRSNGGTYVSKLYLDSKQIATEVTKRQNNFSKNNIKMTNG